MSRSRKPMQRIQLHIEPDLWRRLDTVARGRGVTVVELVREAIASLVARDESAIADDSVLRLAGAISAPDIPSDIAVNHDRYIYADN
ncbi:MAG: hypothetical protein BWY85_01349 [Firmicutes bacterium ADurb.Bin506]|jgi:predicted DNA-binding ribbon-helix-helix protein|nr:MAG: hypothetical protein BWY85_01349 [Firmicutes bacterium ADurb.Bin506]